MSFSNFYFASARKHPYWKNIPEKKWLDWRWQMQNRITDAEQIKKILKLEPNEIKAIASSLKKMRMAVTPYYLSQIDEDDLYCPIRLQAIPTLSELEIKKNEMSDPLHEDLDCPESDLRGVLTHRYPDRLILYATYQCGNYCRHCTRRRFVGEEDLPSPMEKIEKAAAYISKTKTIRDVLISGGDPLTLSDYYLEKIVKIIRKIKHVEVIRIGTRVPVVMPMRITDELCAMLKKYHPLWVHVHFNHPKEMTDLASCACAKLVDAGIPLGNQSVLLRRVNNHPLIMKKLVKLLLVNRIRPYYIYQCDLSQGIEHFRTKISEGLEILENLQGHTSGFSVPTFVIDGPGGGGKVPLKPNYVLSQSHEKWVLRNYEGLIFNYSEPSDYVYKPPSNLEKYIDQQDKEVSGTAELLSDNDKINIVPKDLPRHKRRKATIKA